MDFLLYRAGHLMYALNGARAFVLDCFGEQSYGVGLPPVVANNLDWRIKHQQTDWHRVSASLPFPASGLLARDLWSHGLLTLDLVNGRGNFALHEEHSAPQPFHPFPVTVHRRTVMAVLDLTLNHTMASSTEFLQLACPLGKRLNLTSFHWGQVETPLYAANLEWGSVTRTCSIGVFNEEKANRLQEAGISFVLGNDWLSNGQLTVDPSRSRLEFVSATLSNPSRALRKDINHIRENVLMEIDAWGVANSQRI